MVDRRDMVGKRFRLTLLCSITIAALLSTRIAAAQQLVPVDAAEVPPPPPQAIARQQRVDLHVAPADRGTLAEQLRDSASTKSLAANVLLGIGALGNIAAVVGSILFIVGPLTGGDECVYCTVGLAVWMGGSLLGGIGISAGLPLLFSSRADDARASQLDGMAATEDGVRSARAPSLRLVAWSWHF